MFAMAVEDAVAVEDVEDILTREAVLAAAEAV